MPPRVLAGRLRDELAWRVDRFVEPTRARRLSEGALRQALEAEDVDSLWRRLLERPYLCMDGHDAAARISGIEPGESDRILAAAEEALERRVDLLGSGPVELGSPVDWHRDPKTGRRWPLEYGRTIDYVNLREPSDVKLPWEISRLQWLLPAGQAYLLTGEERYAVAVRDVLSAWIEANPYPLGVNWAIAMEPALRILSWTWLFHACGGSAALAEPGFRASFLRTLYLHGRFVERNMERSSVNGNHYTADAAGLVFAGLFFGNGETPRRWAAEGWQALVAELPRQVLSDGVDFEGSLPYHRLVAELFLLPALYRSLLGLDVPDDYRGRLGAMAIFAAVATRPDGTSPVVGDNDDARALPLGGQGRSDLRYVAGLVGSAWKDPAVVDSFSGPRSETAWLLGPDAASALPDRASRELPSGAFAESGVYVLRAPGAHVLVDCGPVGFAGQGGHGHNDCLGFEAWLQGAPVIVDSGCYVYTASPDWRNRLRATAAHNTPEIDGEEQNHLDPAHLWTLGAEAAPTLLEWRSTDQADLLVASHSGYHRLDPPVTVVRAIALDKQSPTLAVLDRFEGQGEHAVNVPFHLAPGIAAVADGAGRWLLSGPSTELALELEPPAEWTAEVKPSWFAPSYGVLHESSCLELSRRGPLSELLVVVGPVEAPGTLLGRGRALLEAAG
jgi:uncharacterized heparinase superfamily protein